MTDGIEKLRVEKVIDKPLAATDQPKGVDPKIKIVRRWSIVTLRFARGERKSLTVRYKVRCIALDKGFEGAKGPGIGESITLEPKGACVTEIGILNGYVAEESLYYANSRIKKMRVEVEFGEGAENRLALRYGRAQAQWK